MQSPIAFLPTTPTHHAAYSSSAGPSTVFQPIHSSPLAGSSPPSSPASAAHARRRSQYKAHSPSSTSPVQDRVRRRASAAFAAYSAQPAPPTEEAPRKTLLREKLRAKAFERAERSRRRRVESGRSRLASSSDASSDVDADECMDDEDEDSALNDELFRRIVENTRHKDSHQYRLSYAQDVGSSFDPDMEDPEEWEFEDENTAPISVNPSDLLDEELEAYAAEYELGLDDLQAEDIFSLSDFEDTHTVMGDDEDIDMDI